MRNSTANARDRNRLGPVQLLNIIITYGRSDIKVIHVQIVGCFQCSLNEPQKTTKKLKKKKKQWPRRTPVEVLRVVSLVLSSWPHAHSAVVVGWPDGRTELALVKNILKNVRDSDTFSLITVIKSCVVCLWVDEHRR